MGSPPDPLSSIPTSGDKTYQCFEKSMKKGLRASGNLPTFETLDKECHLQKYLAKICESHIPCLQGLTRFQRFLEKNGVAVDQQTHFNQKLLIPLVWKTDGQNYMEKAAGISVQVERWWAEKRETPAQRIRAAQELAKYSPDEATPLLLEFLRQEREGEDPSAEVALQVLHSLRQRGMKTPQVTRALSTMVKNESESALIRAAALLTLAHLDGESSFPIAKELVHYKVETGHFPYHNLLRTTAMIALFLHGTPPAMALLRELPQEEALPLKERYYADRLTALWDAIPQLQSASLLRKELPLPSPPLEDLTPWRQILDGPIVSDREESGKSLPVVSRSVQWLGPSYRLKDFFKPDEFKKVWQQYYDAAPKQFVNSPVILFVGVPPNENIGFPELSKEIVSRLARAFDHSPGERPGGIRIVVYPFRNVFDDWQIDLAKPAPGVDLQKLILSPELLASKTNP